MGNIVVFWGSDWTSPFSSLSGNVAFYNKFRLLWPGPAAVERGSDQTSEIQLWKISSAIILIVPLAGHSTTPQSYSCRCVCISAYVIAVVIFGTYSATVISFLTVQQTKLPYSDLKSLMVTGGYTFGLSSTHAQNYISEVQMLQMGLWQELSRITFDANNLKICQHGERKLEIK